MLATQTMACTRPLSHGLPRSLQLCPRPLPCRTLCPSLHMGISRVMNLLPIAAASTDAYSGADEGTDSRPAPEMRPGDWVCDECGKHNYARRTVCFGCKAQRPGAEFSSSSDSSSGSKFELLPGDWNCPSCGQHNFKRRRYCFRCNEPNPEGPSQGGGRGDYGDRRAPRGDYGDRRAPRGEYGDRRAPRGEYGARGEEARNRPGDWTCPDCGDVNFAFRTTCRKCDCERPESAGSTARYEPRSRPGDWVCECGVSNFATRTECRSCQAPKP